MTRNRQHQTMPIRLLAVVAAALLTLTIPAPPPAQAANPTLNFYISPPTVQNTFVQGARVATFNDKTAGQPCPTNWQADDGTPIGTITTTGCTIRAADQFGGAVPGLSDQPFVGGGTPIPAGTNYVGIPSGKQVTLTLERDESYLGFWWSAGDENNKVELFSGGTTGTRVGVFTTASLKEMLKETTVTAIDGEP